MEEGKDIDIKERDLKGPPRPDSGELTLLFFFSLSHTGTVRYNFKLPLSLRFL